MIRLQALAVGLRSIAILFHSPRLINLTIVCAFTISLALSSSTVRADSQTVSWHIISDNLSVARMEMNRGLFFSSELTLIRVGLQGYRIGVIRATDFGLTRASARTLCKKAKAVACINANFFDENGKPLGLIVTRGLTLQGLHRGGKTLTGVFQISRQLPSIVNRTDFSAAAVVEAVQAGPRLISGGVPVVGLREDTSSNRRSGVCIDREQRVILYLLNTGFFGTSLKHLRDALISSMIGCEDALNLDGGGSAQLYIEPSHVQTGQAPIDLEGTDDVPLVLGVFQRAVAH